MAEKNTPAPMILPDGSLLQNYVMTGLLVLGAFIIGMLFTEVKYLKKGAPTAAPSAQAPAANDPSGGIKIDPEKVVPVGEGDHIRGDENAKVTLIEYSDYECPFCKRFHPTMQAILEKYKGKVRWVFRHYPLPGHPNAQKAAETAECVAKLTGDEGFWKYTDLYYTRTSANGTGIALDAMAKLANEASGANQAAVQACLDSDEMADKVQEQMDGGSKVGVTGTPGLIIFSEGKADYINGAYPIEVVGPVIEKHL